MQRLKTVNVLILAGISVSLILLIHWTGATKYIDYYIFDFASKRYSDPGKIPANGVLVLIDEQTLNAVSQDERYRYRWPWPRHMFAGLVAGIHKAGARKIVVDLLFSERSGRTEEDDVLASFLAAIPGVVLARHNARMPVFWSDEAIGENGILSRYLADNPGIRLRDRTGHVEYLADEDGIVRNYFLKDSVASRALTGFRENASRIILKWYGTLEDFNNTGHAYSAVHFLYAGMRIFGEAEQRCDIFDPGDVGRFLESLPELDGEPFINLRNKVVFIGTNAAATYDIKALPVGAKQPAVLIHFTAWANTEYGYELHRTSSDVLLLVTAGVILVVICLGWLYPGLIILFPATVAVLLLTVVTTMGCFKTGLYIPPSDIFAGTLIALMSITAGNYVQEKRNRMQIKEMFGTYVSEKVVENLLANPESIKFGGEKKDVTVYFSDLAGFTALSEIMAPENLVSLINLYLNEMSNYIIDNGGYLNKYVGDAIMGVFGAPEELDNHALAACKAALQSKEHLNILNERIKDGWGVMLKARIGINTDNMTVGNFGSSRKKDYTVVGEGVNLASRLESANKLFETDILLGSRTEHLARGYIVSRPIGLLIVKGKQEPVQIFELLGLPGSVDDALLEFLDFYSKGYNAFLHREFNEAKHQFGIAKKLYPFDKIINMYYDKAAGFSKTPPPGDWDGVFVMTTK